MKRIPTLLNNLAPLLAFGAHPDDIEFACGGVIAMETRAGRKAYFVVCSHGEAASHGTPKEREREAKAGARVLGASIEFLKLDGDAHLEIRAEHSIKLAKIIRRVRPGIVLAPTLVTNQHPDHWRLGNIVRDAVRIARYGGVKELKALRLHAVGQLLFYASTNEAEPKDATPLLVDVSEPEIVAVWQAAMESHSSQTNSRRYVKNQLSRAEARGLSAGVTHAIALYAIDPIVLCGLSSIERGARGF